MDPSFLSLPEEIIFSCLARIPRPYYPNLVLVCKTFRSLIVSKELNDARSDLKTKETVFQVCLQFPNDPCPSWFTLWIKPSQTLINQRLDEEKTTSTQNVRLVPITSSCCYSYQPLRVVSVGSEMYGFSQYSAPSSNMWVRNKETGLWDKAPNMSVARVNAMEDVLNGKLYVMGGHANYGEVFDPKTQTWEPLPNPSVEHNFSSTRQIQVIQGKIYVITNDETTSVYDLKEGKWDVGDGPILAQYMIDNVWYSYDKQKCLWYDKNRDKWRAVKGLAMFNKNLGSDTIELANYNGKLLILWDKFGTCRQYKDIWCAAIALERRNDTIWGKIEWSSVVLTVPSSYIFLRGRLYFVQPGPCRYKEVWCTVIALEIGDGIDEVWGNIKWVNIVLTVPYVI